jgi:hypothetical protein
MTVTPRFKAPQQRRYLLEFVQDERRYVIETEAPTDTEAKRKAKSNLTVKIGQFDPHKAICTMCVELAP